MMLTRCSGYFCRNCAEAETLVVESVDQLAHRFDALIQFRLIVTEPRAGKIIAPERLVNAVSSQLGHL